MVFVVRFNEEEFPLVSRGDDDTATWKRVAVRVAGAGAGRGCGKRLRVGGGGYSGGGGGKGGVAAVTAGGEVRRASRRTRNGSTS